MRCLFARLSSTSSGQLYLFKLAVLVGPTFVGIASDFFRADFGGHSLQMAFSALAPTYLVAALLFWWLARLIKRSSPPSSALWPRLGGRRMPVSAPGFVVGSVGGTTMLAQRA